MSEPVTVATTDELDPGDGVAVEVDGEAVALFNIDGEFHAIGNTCPHMGGPLGDGDVTDSTVSCPWHGAEFDATSGEVLGPPANESVPEYDVTVDGSEVKIRV
jgi:nitrite reductase (NADH) small subunit